MEDKNYARLAIEKEPKPEDVNKEFHPRCMMAVPLDIEELLASLEDE